MAATTQNRYGERQPGEYVAYSGGSGYHYYKDTLLIKQGVAANTIIPLTAAGSCNGYFLGVIANEVDLTAGLGSSQEVLNVWKQGVFTFVANGTGVTAHIGQQAWGLDNQTVGVSIGQPALSVGEIVGIPTPTSYRVRINAAVGIYGSSRAQN